MALAEGTFKVGSVVRWKVSVAFWMLIGTGSLDSVNSSCRTVDRVLSSYGAEKTTSARPTVLITRTDSIESAGA